MAIATRAGVKLLMQIPSATTTHDSLIDSLLDAADTAVKRWCGRNLEAAAGIVEYPTAYSTNTFRLRETPLTVSGLTSIYYDLSANYGRGSGDFASGTLLVDGTDYALRIDQTDGTTSKSGLVERLGGVWEGRRARRPGYLTVLPEARTGHIKVTYNCTGAYGSAPEVILAANMVVVRMMNAGRTGGRLQSESYAGYSYSMAQVTPGLITDEIALLLVPYQYKSA